MVESKPQKKHFTAIALDIPPNQVGQAKDCFSLDILLVSKISKRHFFRDISNFCQWVTQTRLEPNQKNFFEKISKIKAASPILIFLLFWQEIHF